MADKKISEFPVNSVPALDDFFAIVDLSDAGATKRMPLSGLYAYFNTLKAKAQYRAYESTQQTTITSLGTYEFIQTDGTPSGPVAPVDFTLTDNRATYNGTVAKSFKVIATVGARALAGDSIGFKIAVSGTPVDNSISLGDSSPNNEFQTISLHDVITLNPGNYVEIWGTNYITLSSGGGSLRVVYMNVIIEEF